MGFVIASSYPLLDVFWTLLLIAGLFLWLWLVVAVFIDVFRSRDLSGPVKALWTVAVLLLPLVGVLVYLGVRGRGMPDRAVAEATAEDERAREHFRRHGDGSKAPAGGEPAGRGAA